MKYKGHRVGVFVDVQNLFYSAKNLYNAYPDYSKILKHVVDNRQLICAFAYVVSANLPKQDEFFNALTNVGFEVKTKDLQIFPGGIKKGNWDVGIAVDILRFKDRVDAIILVSGDGDFTDLIQYLKQQGVKAEVAAYSRSCSAKLKEAADEFTDLDINSDNYLMKKLPIKKIFDKKNWK